MDSYAIDVIVIDKEGDAILTLEDISPTFAIWEPDDDDSLASGDEVNTNGPKNSTMQDTDEESLEGKFHNLRTASLGSGSTDEVLPSKAYRVSSSHLINASAKFRHELRGPWKENCLDKDGSYHLTASGWDAEAFKIMLEVFHLHHRQLPRELSLDMLAKMAMLVDYYQCWEAFDLIAPHWIEAALRLSKGPMVYGRDTMLWMYVSWVFKIPDVFTKTTATAVRLNDEEDVRDMELGVPPAILDALRSRRLEMIEAVLSKCHKWMKIWSGDYTCPSSGQEDASFACSSMLLGALTKELTRLELLSPQPQAPYHGWSVYTISAEILAIKSPSWSAPFEKSGWYATHACKFDNTIIPNIVTLLKTVEGLRLEEFRDRAEETS